MRRNTNINNEYFIRKEGFKRFFLQTIEIIYGKGFTLEEVEEVDGAKLIKISYFNSGINYIIIIKVYIHKLYLHCAKF